MAKEGKQKLAVAESGMSTVRAVDRAIAILQCFTPEKPAMSVIEIQKRVGLSRPTLYRLLHTLSTRGLILADGDPQRFKLTFGVMQLAHVWLKGLEVVTVARPIVEELRDRTGETAALFRLQEERGICILESESRHTLSISRGVGDALKINQGATGKAILAFMDEQRQKTFFASMPRNVNLAQLQKSLKATKRNGFAVSRGEIFAGAVAVASPYFDHRGSVAGSIGLYGPQARVDESKIILFGKLVDDAGRRVSALLGFQTSEL